MTDATHTPHGESPTRCPTCRAALRPGTSRCPMCGTKLGDSTPPLHPADETLPDASSSAAHEPELIPPPWAPIASPWAGTPPTGAALPGGPPAQLPTDGAVGSAFPPSAPPRPPRRPRPPVTSRGVAASVAAFVAGVVLVVAAFVPWLSASGTDVNGWHLTGDARVLFVVGLVAIGLGSLILAGFADSPAVWVLLAVGAAIGAAYGVADIVDIVAGNVGDVVHGHVHLGPGPWLVVGASVLLVIGAVLAATSRPAAPSTDSVSGSATGA